MKLYVTDLDGTLFNHKAQISIVSRDILNREIKNGASVTYATARSLSSASAKTAEVNFDLPVIVYNGVFIVDPKSKKQLISHYFSDDSKRTAADFFTEHEESLLVYSYIDGIERVSWLKSSVSAGVRRYISERKGDPRLRECKTFNELFEGDVFYITLIEPKTPMEALDEVFYNKNGLTRNYQADTYNTKEYWYEIFCEGVSKANAVAELKALLDADEVIAFGDNVNDLPMIKNADRGYAAANAAHELKQAAYGVIRSNEQSGVPVFIANDRCKVWDYQRHNEIEPADANKFSRCLAAYVPDNDGIGTLNEKQIHSVLKSYFAVTAYDKEIKIGNFYADLVTENGIFEIQTDNFKNLVNKLDSFLQAVHVTVVYPFHKITRLNYVDASTGELLKTGAKTMHKNLTDFFLELYRIKQYLNDPNLTVCIAELSVDNYRFTKKDMKRRKSDRKMSVPVSLENLVFLEDSNSYKRFIPNELSDRFTRKELAGLLKTCDTSLFIEIMKDVGLIDFAGKKGNEYLFIRTDK